MRFTRSGPNHRPRLAHSYSFIPHCARMVFHSSTNNQEDFVIRMAVPPSGIAGICSLDIYYASCWEAKAVYLTSRIV